MTDEERAEIAAAVALALANARASEKRMLAAERSGRMRITKSVANATNAVVTAATNTRSSRTERHEVAAAIRSSMVDLQEDIEDDVHATLHEARQAAGSHGLTTVGSAEAEAMDRVSAVSAAWTLASVWASASIAAVVSSGDKSIAKATAKVPVAMDARIRNVAATENARAFNSERALLEPEESNRAAAYQIWITEDGSNTCSMCAGLSGAVVELGDTFSEGNPPLHPNCRCFIEHLISPHGRGVDPEAFRKEVQRVVRSDAEVAAKAETTAADRAPPLKPQAPVAKRIAKLTAKEAEAIGIEVSGDIEAVAKNVFGDVEPTFSELEQMFAPPEGYSAKLRFVDASEGKVNVSLHLYDGEQRLPDMLERTFRRDADGSLVVAHDFFHLPERLQGKGISKEILRNSLRGYEKIGVKAVELDAHFVGRYTWGRFGFSWPASEASEWQTSFGKYLREVASLSPAQAAEIAASAKTTHELAAIEIGGKKVGKSFLLDDEYVPSWRGTLRLEYDDPGYQVAKERLKL